MPGIGVNRELLVAALLAALLHAALFYMPAGSFRGPALPRGGKTITLAIGMAAAAKQKEAVPAPPQKPEPGVEEKKPAIPEPEPKAEKPEPVRPEPKPVEKKEAAMPRPVERKVAAKPRPPAPVEEPVAGRGEALAPPSHRERAGTSAKVDSSAETGDRAGENVAALPGPEREGAAPGDAAKGPLTLARPDYLNNPKPDYPRIALRRGYEGTAVLWVVVSREGEPLSVSLKESSGHDSLDRAAVDAVEEWVFVPAKRGDEPVESRVEVPVSFRLER